LACPVCENSALEDLHQSKDFTTTGELFHVKQCAQCGMGLTTPRPTATDASRYYKATAYISHNSKVSGLFSYIYLIIRRLTVKWKYSLVKPYLSNGSILDFGCGTGHFLQEVARHNIPSFGVEPSEDARKGISNSIVTADSLAGLPNKNFSVITLWHVIEHVYALRETLSTLRERLNDNGIIFIAVPNLESYDSKYYAEHWAALDVPRHIWHFTKSCMVNLLQKEGFKVKEIKPMKLDSYYVSLLSEKYRHGGRFTFLGILNALRIGIKSNMLGARDTSHSSLIYIAERA
jgi:2-polyprenyl-3-methyl-5-hydroxy-6-metoxy-1,4-benzoquinol methylase